MTQSRFFSFPSPAKLNLFLHITGQRDNGYHDLQTLFQFLDYGDTIEISVNDSSNIKLLTPIEGVANEDNLIVKAAVLLKSYATKNITDTDKDKITAQGADIKINKILPMGGGLGGGSSNAATILLALNGLWRLNLTVEQLAEIGLALGADVPVFVRGSAAFAEGVGEILTPCAPKEYWYLVTRPNCHISTQSVFTSTDLPRDTEILELSTLDLSKVAETCHNDCQTMVIKHYPEVANLLAWLIEYAPSQMTGTGACIFTCFDTEDEARQLQSKLPKDVHAFVAKGLNRSSVTDAVNSAVAILNS